MSDVAQLVLPSIRWSELDGFRGQRRRIEKALELGVGGFVVYRAPAAAVAELTRDLQAASRHPLLVSADLERGAAQQAEGLTELPPPAALGWLNDPETTELAGLATAAEARGVGINWAFAPVADLDTEAANPIVQTRSFGADAELVGRHVAGWVRGCESGGVLSTVKHFPGHGRTMADSHETLPEVDASLDELARTDLIPFRLGVEAGASAVMPAHVAFPTWTGTRTAATFSPAILGYLRREWDFEGAVITDALIMQGAVQENPEVVASRLALEAGCDLLLYPRDFEGVIAGLDAWSVTAAGQPAIDRALGRRARLAERAAAPASRTLPAAIPLPDGSNAPTPAAFADALADGVLHLLRGDAPVLRAPFEVDIVDDDVGGPYQIPPRDVFHQTLEAAGAELGAGGSRALLVYSEPRSWKGRAELGPDTLAALAERAPAADVIVFFAPPRFTRQVPGAAPLLGAWHGMALLQRAAARWVLRQAR